MISVSECDSTGHLHVAKAAPVVFLLGCYPLDLKQGDGSVKIERPAGSQLEIADFGRFNKHPEPVCDNPVDALPRGRGLSLPRHNSSAKSSFKNGG